MGNPGFSFGTAFGDPDLAVTSDMNEPNRLWRSDSPSGHHGLGLRLRNMKSNRSAIGARVAITTSEGFSVREISGGNCRSSQKSLPLEFGQGSAVVVEEVTVRWPNGTVQTDRNLSLDRHLTFTEPVGAVRRSGGHRAPEIRASARELDNRYRILEPLANPVTKQLGDLSSIEHRASSQCR